MDVKEIALEVLLETVQWLQFLLRALWIVLRELVLAFVPRKKSLEDEVVLITGAGRGMGKQLAKLVAETGATVVLWDIDEKGVRQTWHDIITSGGRAFWFVCDVSSEEDVKRRAEDVERDVGRVTILVNNAGIMQNLPILSLDSDRIRRTMDINVLAHFWTIRVFLPQMEKQNKGHIVGIASAAGLIGHVNQSDYSASKHAVVGLMEALSEELRLREVNVKTTTICPLTIDTGMNQNPITRCSWLMPIISVESAAAQVLSAIQREDILVTLPRSTLWSLRFVRLLPRQVLSDFMDTTDYCRVSNVDNTHISARKDI